MQRARNIRSKSPRKLDREIEQALAGRRGVPGYSNYGGGGSFAPMASPPSRSKKRPASKHGHATKALTPTARARASTLPDKNSDKITIDELAKTLGLPDWEKIDEMNQHHYWEVAHGAGDEEAQLDAERAEQDEVYRKWYDAVEHVAEKLFAEHGLELLAMKHTRKVQQNYRPHQLKIIPATSWSDAADKIRETINGVGMFHFNNLREFLDSGPYTARKAVLSHLGSIRSYPAVYGSHSAHQMYENAWR